MCCHRPNTKASCWFIADTKPKSLVCHYKRLIQNPAACIYIIWLIENWLLHKSKAGHEEGAMVMADRKCEANVWNCSVDVGRKRLGREVEKGMVLDSSWDPLYFCVCFCNGQSFLMIKLLVAKKLNIFLFPQQDCMRMIPAHDSGEWSQVIMKSC